MNASPTDSVTIWTMTTRSAQRHRGEGKAPSGNRSGSSQTSRLTGTAHAQFENHAATWSYGREPDPDSATSTAYVSASRFGAVESTSAAKIVPIGLPARRRTIGGAINASTTKA